MKTTREHRHQVLVALIGLFVEAHHERDPMADDFKTIAKVYKAETAPKGAT